MAALWAVGGGGSWLLRHLQPKPQQLPLLAEVYEASSRAAQHGQGGEVEGARLTWEGSLGVFCSPGKLSKGP